MFNRTIKEKSLAYLYPDIAAEWHPTKNKSRTPLLVPAGSNQKAWWMGRCGHEWETKISHRTDGSGCPYCSNQRLLPGFNDLETLHPTIAMEWHQDKNGLITPHDVLSGSYSEYWWKCKMGHEWKASVRSRYQNSKYFGCPYCSGHRVWPGFNDICTTHPHLLDEWDYEKNSKSPTEVSKGSYYEAWWIGIECRHEYQMKVNIRVMGCGCPYCAKKRVLSGFNDIAFLKPEWLSLFDYDKNELRPNELMPNTSKKLWWKCFNGHSYQRSGNTMMKTTNCPFCKIVHL